MHTTIDYSKSPAPKFDALQDIIEYLGQAKWDEIYLPMSEITNCEHFDFYCSLAGIRGLPVIAWYEHYHGEGSWKL